MSDPRYLRPGVNRRSASDPMPCRKCGEVHTGCAGHSKRTGRPCTQDPMHGQRVCRLHGGKSPQALRSAGRRLEREHAERIVAGLALELDVDPTTALLAAVRRAAGAVWFLEQQVNGLGSIVTVDQGPGGAVSERVHVLAEEYRLWCDRLVTYSSSALKAGVDERRIQVEESLAAQLGQLVRDLLGAPELGLDEDRQEAGLEVASRLMRALPAAA